MLGTTFGGNHLACAAALAVIDIIDGEGLIDNARAVGDYLLENLRQMPQLTDVRGRGLMIGIEINGSAPELRRNLLFEDHVFTGGAGQHTVRLLPALTLTKSEADKFLLKLKHQLSK